MVVGRLTRESRAGTNGGRGGFPEAAAVENVEREAPSVSASDGAPAIGDDVALRQAEWEKLIRWSRLKKRREGGDANNDALRRAKKIVVFGGGSFGTAMASVLGMNKASLEVVMLLRDETICADINEKKVNTRYLKEYELPPNVTATTDAAAAIADAQYAVHAVPVQASRAFFAANREHIPPTLPIICLSKGLELSSGLTMADLIAECLGEEQPLAIVSGPSFAVEVMQQKPTSLVAASEDLALAKACQQLFACPYLRVNQSSDVLGVEIAGALKNVLAIAAGIVDGMELGHNAMAALVQQGCSEIRWLATAMGAQPTTIFGLAGVGDIMLTCFVNLSRNRSVGVRLGKGEKLEDILSSTSQVAEGVATAASVIELAQQYGVSLPVLTAVANVVAGKLTPKQAVYEIMALPQVAER